MTTLLRSLDHHLWVFLKCQHRFLFFLHILQHHLFTDFAHFLFSIIICLAVFTPIFSVSAAILFSESSPLHVPIGFHCYWTTRSFICHLPTHFFLLKTFYPIQNHVPFIVCLLHTPHNNYMFQWHFSWVLKNVLLTYSLTIMPIIIPVHKWRHFFTWSCSTVPWMNMLKPTAAHNKRTVLV
jgi:hypothetical protein